MGAKTVMTVALRNPDSCANIIAVDNAPVDAALASDFPRYVEGMRKVEEAKCKSQKEADEILEPYAKVRCFPKKEIPTYFHLFKASDLHSLVEDLDPTQIHSTLRPLTNVRQGPSSPPIPPDESNPALTFRASQISHPSTNTSKCAG
jgi:pimeloyl-ACP methyl ester carboxylesterase